jgi:hypothetical protein
MGTRGALIIDDKRTAQKLAVYDTVYNNVNMMSVETISKKLKIPVCKFEYLSINTDTNGDTINEVKFGTIHNTPI